MTDTPLEEDEPKEEEPEEPRPPETDWPENEPSPHAGEEGQRDDVA